MGPYRAMQDKETGDWHVFGPHGVRVRARGIPPVFKGEEGREEACIIAAAMNVAYDAGRRDIHGTGHVNITEV